MKSAFIVKDKTGKPYAVIALLSGGTEFYPIAESATGWASWMKDEYAARVITKQQLVATLDNSMDVEGPLVTNRSNKVKIDELIAKAKKTQEVEPIESAKEEKSAELVPVISLMDARLDYLDNSEWRNAVEFKAKSFIADVNKSTFSYEVKRTRAVFDDSLAIPGTNRRGGWRCPPGTRYGGQITDRFGRNCGWGVSRRLANEIADLGERMEDAGDKRRVRRVERRNERVGRRLAQGGRLERAARGVGNALDLTNNRESGDVVDTPKPRGAGLAERVAGRIGDFLEAPNARNRRQQRGTAPSTDRPGILERAAGRVAQVLDSDGGTPAPQRPRPQAPQARPARPRQPRAPRQPQGMNLFPNRSDEQLIEDWHNTRRYTPPRGQIGMNMAIEDEKRRKRALIETEMGARGIKIPKERTDDEAIAAALGRNRPQVDNVSKTPVPAGPPRAAETLDQYKTRKYNEHQQRVREINNAGGNAGFLTRDEWEQFHGPEVEAAYNRRNAAGRGARRTATNAGAARTATRRPKPADVPDANQPARRQRKPFNAPGQRGVNDLAAARRKRTFIEQDNPAQRGDYKIVKHNGKYFVVSKAEVDRANANGANLDVHNEPPRPGPRLPAAPAPAAPAAPNVTPPSPAGNAERPKLKEDGTVVHRILGRLVSRSAKDGVLPTPHTQTRQMTKQEAIDHVKNGGSLSEVPRDQLLAAVEGNIWSVNNPTGKFVSVNKNGGIIGDTRLYAAVDARGKKQGHGLVFKGASQDDNVGEVMGFNFAAAHGFDVEGAQADGVINGTTFIAIPFNTNNVPSDWKRVPTPNAGGRNYHIAPMEQLPDKAAPQRVAHFIHNYLLGVGDRHHGNGMGSVYEKPDGTKVVHIVPIDAGWANAQGVGLADDFEQYGRDSMWTNNRIGMDGDMFRKIKTHISSLTGEEKERQRQAIISAVDDMIEKSKKLSSQSDNELKDAVRGFYPGVSEAQIAGKASNVINAYKRKSRYLERNRAQLLELLGVD